MQKLLYNFLCYLEWAFKKIDKCSFVNFIENLCINIRKRKLIKSVIPMDTASYN